MAVLNRKTEIQSWNFWFVKAKAFGFPNWAYLSIKGPPG
jgi:hypothetical protein